MGLNCICLIEKKKKQIHIKIETTHNEEKFIQYTCRNQYKIDNETK